MILNPPPPLNQTKGVHFSTAAKSSAPQEDPTTRTIGKRASIADASSKIRAYYMGKWAMKTNLDGKSETLHGTKIALYHEYGFG